MANISIENRHSSDYSAAGDRMYTGNATGIATKRISWGAVFAGALVAIVVQLALSLLGIGIGMSTIDPLEESNPLSGLGTGAIIWWAITILIALFAGGYVAGRMAGIPRFFESSLHGVLAWCLFTLFTFYLLTTAVGRIVGGATRVLGSAVSLAGQGVAAAAPEIGQEVNQQLAENNIDLSNIKEEAEQLLRQTGKPELQPENLERRTRQAGEALEGAAGNTAENPQAADENLNGIIDRLFAQGQNAASAVDRDAAINVIVARTGKSRQEAAQIVDNWINTYQQANAKFQQTKAQAAAKARQVSDQAAEATSKAGIWGFIGLLIAGAAAAFGARLATPKDVIVTAPAV